MDTVNNLIFLSDISISYLKIYVKYIKLTYMTQNKTFFGACTLMKGIVDTVGYGGYANFIYYFLFLLYIFVCLLFDK